MERYGNYEKMRTAMDNADKFEKALTKLKAMIYEDADSIVVFSGKENEKFEQIAKYANVIEDIETSFLSEYRLAYDAYKLTTSYGEWKDWEHKISPDNPFEKK